MPSHSFLKRSASGPFHHVLFTWLEICCVAWAICCRLLLELPRQLIQLFNVSTELSHVPYSFDSPNTQPLRIATSRS